MLNDPRSHGLWETTAPPAPETPALSRAIKADVAIVGCGYTGLSAALHLAEAGAKVVALEAVEIGYGGAGRNVGLVNAGMWVTPDEVSAALGVDYGERALTLLGGGPAEVWGLIEKHNIACDPVRAGTLHCALGPKGLAEIEERCRQWGARGAPVSLLDAEAAARRIGTSAYSGALLDMRAGTIQPLAYARGLAHAVLEASAAIHTRSPVRGFERKGVGWAIGTGAGSVEADWIVVATDIYGVAPWPQLRREQLRLPYFNFATKPLPAPLQAAILPNREGCWDTKEILSSFRYDSLGRLIFGSVGALRRSGLAVHRAWAKRALRRIFPAIGAVEFDAEWYGFIGMTDNALPRFHRLAPNVVSFSGYNGRGIAPGTVFGRVLADHVLGRLGEKDMPLPLSEPDAPSFPAVREAYYETGAEIAHALGARF